jgi:hypothetical protein
VVEGLAQSSTDSRSSVCPFPLYRFQHPSVHASRYRTGNCGPLPPSRPRCGAGRRCRGTHSSPELPPRLRKITQVRLSPFGREALPVNLPCAPLKYLAPK